MKTVMTLDLPCTVYADVEEMPDGGMRLVKVTGVIWPEFVTHGDRGLDAPELIDLVQRGLEREEFEFEDAERCSDE